MFQRPQPLRSGSKGPKTILQMEGDTKHTALLFISIVGLCGSLWVSVAILCFFVIILSLLVVILNFLVFFFILLGILEKLCGRFVSLVGCFCLFMILLSLFLLILCFFVVLSVLDILQLKPTGLLTP